MPRGELSGNSSRAERSLGEQTRSALAARLNRLRKKSESRRFAAQGLKPSLVLHDLRGAKAPLYHSAAGFRDFFRSLLGVCMPRKSSRKNPSRPARADGVLTVMDSARRGELVAIVGTGVSIGLTDNKIPALSWRGLILHGFAHGVQKGTISAAQEKAWRMQL